MGSIKPMDKEALLDSVKKTGCFLSVEEHSIIGGMGSAVSEMLSVNFPVSMDFIGIDDCFTESGPYDTLLKKYGIHKDFVCGKAEKLVASKLKK